MQETSSVTRQDNVIDTRLDPRKPASETIFVKLDNGAEIAVPNELAHITAYVVAEQETWFEPELGFWQNALEPGQTVFDVGANHGIFSLSLAPVVGETGRVIAFEPGTQARRYLQAGVARAATDMIEIVPHALSDHAHRASLYGAGGGQAVMSEVLSLKARSGQASIETVDVSTLDAEWERLGRPVVDFVKLDVEGLEIEVIEGGDAMIRAAEPMIMFEISGDRKAATAIGERLHAKGYGIYRLVPGLDMLVPFSLGELSKFQLNLIALTPKRAQSLARRGLLVRQEDLDQIQKNGLETFVTIPEEDWPQPMLALPCWRSHGELPKNPVSRLDLIRHGNPANPYREALWLAAAALDDEELPAVRYICLRQACAMTAKLMQTEKTFRASLARLWTTARLATMCGFRELALDALGHAGRLLNRPPESFAEPFLPAASHFDIVEPGEDLVEWAAMMTIDPLVTIGNHSSRFTNGEALPALERWQCSRFLTPALDRRRQLLRIRIGLQAGLFATPALERTPLNPHLLQSEDIDPAERDTAMPLAS